MAIYDSVTLLFPGQGSQYVGMGDALKSKNEDEEFYQYLLEADTALDFSLSSLMSQGPEEELRLTHNTQPAIVAHSYALFKKLQKTLEMRNIKIGAVLGHSVGEYSALAAAGSLSLSDAVKAVRARGTFMQEAVPVGKGKMYAVLKVPQEIVIKACLQSSESDEKVMPANFNEPNQIVISGHASACDRAVKWLEENHQDPFRAVELNVSAPFHSSLMEPAAERLKNFLSEISFQESQIPYIANIDGEEYGAGTTPEIIKDNLYRQVAGSVLWTQSIQKVDPKSLCLEVGPGKVLTGLMRKINRDIKTLPLDKEGAFQELEELLS